MENIEMGIYLKFQNAKERESVLAVEDKVFCVSKNKIIVGELKQISLLENNTLYKVIFIKEEKGEDNWWITLNIYDIDYICKYSEIVNNEEFYIRIMIAIGYNEEQIKSLYYNVKICKVLFNLKIEQLIEASLYAIKNQCDIYKAVNELYSLNLYKRFFGEAFKLLVRCK